MTDPTWRAKKMRQLCDERHPILSRLRQLRPGVGVQSRKRIASLSEEERRLRRLIAHIHRELDFYEMQEAKPGFDAMRARLRETRALYRKVVALTQSLTHVSDPPKEAQ